MTDRPAADATVALALVVYEPEGQLLPLLQAHLPELVARYAALIAFCSRTTHPAILETLEHHGVMVRFDGGEPRGITRIGGKRRETVRAALDAATSHVHLCDFDRALHWVAHYPQEMEQVAAAITRHDFLVLGRTPRAWATHPPYQTRTEVIFNHVFRLSTGLAWDVGAGARGLSRRAAESLLENSADESVGSDAEWPLLMLRQRERGFQVGYRACDGLEFETADRCAADIAAAGSYAAWEARMGADPRRWAFRLQVAQLIAEAVARHHAE